MLTGVSEVKISKSFLRKK